MFQCHQGDVYLRQVKALPKYASPVRTDDRIVLAHGEVTGHAHVIHGGAVLFRADEGRGTYLQVVETDVELVHEEHAKIALPVGLFEVIVQSQYCMSAIHNVTD